LAILVVAATAAAAAIGTTASAARQITSGAARTAETAASAATDVRSRGRAAAGTPDGCVVGKVDVADADGTCVDENRPACAQTTAAQSSRACTTLCQSVGEASKVCDLNRLTGRIHEKDSVCGSPIDREATAVDGNAVRQCGDQATQREVGGDLDRVRAGTRICGLNGLQQFSVCGCLINVRPSRVRQTGGDEGGGAHQDSGEQRGPAPLCRACLDLLTRDLNGLFHFNQPHACASARDHVIKNVLKTMENYQIAVADGYRLLICHGSENVVLTRSDHSQSEGTGGNGAGGS